MKPHHILTLAAVMFLGTALYAAYSTPTNGSGFLALTAPLIAAITSTYLAFRSRATHATDPRPPRTAVIAHLVLVVILLGAAAFAVASLPKPTPGQPAPGETVITEDVTQGARTSGFTITKTPHVSTDTTHTFAAAGFSAGVALLAAVTLAFLRISDCDERREPSPAA